jgi:DNA-binding response OmpR family regulator
MLALTDILGARILIVDDQQSNLRLLEYALRRAGYVGVASTTEPLEVSALHRQNHYDLIILDLQMPHMSGFQVMEELAKVERGKRVVILILSADPSQTARALEAGATGFLSKPFVLAEVVLRVRLMLEERMSRAVPKRPLATAPAVFPRAIV